MKRLTEIELKALRPADAGRRLRDEHGVFGIVHASQDGAVSVHFRLRYRIDGRVREVRIGTWPKVSLAGIRDEREKVKADKRSRVDPAERRLAERLKVRADIVENERRLAEEAERREAERLAEAARLETERLDNLSVQDLYDVWLRDGVARKDGNAEIRRMFEKDILPAIGAKPVRLTTEHDLTALLRAMVARGVNRMAVRARNDIVQMFSWAERRQPWRTLMSQGNPALLIDIEKIVSPDFDLSGERERILSVAEVRELRDIFERVEAEYEAAPNKYKAIRPLSKPTQLAVWICLSTLCRIGELLMTEWKYVDLERGEWFIPKAIVKGRRGKKQDQLVFLSAFALRQFKALHALTGNARYCYPARNTRDDDGVDTHVCVKSVSKQIGDRQIRFKDRKPLKNRQHNDTLVLADGENGEWTPHDLRRTGATWMQELHVSLDVIDRCQNHVLQGSRVRRHYLHYDYAAEKREAWRLLGERIEAILSADNVVPIREVA